MLKCHFSIFANQSGKICDFLSQHFVQILGAFCIAKFGANVLLTTQIQPLPDDVASTHDVASTYIVASTISVTINIASTDVTGTDNVSSSDNVASTYDVAM